MTDCCSVPHIQLTPGLANLHPRVLTASASANLDPRGSAFTQTYFAIEERLQEMLGTKQDVLLAGGNGTAMMELAVVNLVNPGDRVLVVSQGEFGNRFADILAAFQADVHVLNVSIGAPASPAILQQTLADLGSIAACFMVHVETSVGIRCDLPALAATIRSCCPDALVVVDAMTALAAHEIQFDTWELDAIVSTGHKAIGAPVGIGFIALSNRAWDRCPNVDCFRYCDDLPTMREFHRRGQSRHVLPLQAFQGLAAALDMIADIGLNAFRSHLDSLAGAVRRKLGQIGLGLTATPEQSARTVTCAWLREGISSTALVQRLQKAGIAMATGRGPLQERILRIGHLGLGTSLTDVEIGMDALATCLGAHGKPNCVA